MLVKLGLSNIEILNREAVIKQLQQGNDKISLILKPTWYAEYATIGHLWSVPGWTMEEFEANSPAQYYAIFLKQNGEFSIDLAVQHTEFQPWETAEMNDVKEEGPPYYLATSRGLLRSDDGQNWKLWSDEE